MKLTSETCFGVQAEQSESYPLCWLGLVHSQGRKGLYEKQVWARKQKKMGTKKSFFDLVLFQNWVGPHTRSIENSHMSFIYEREDHSKRKKEMRAYREELAVPRKEVVNDGAVEVERLSTKHIISDTVRKARDCLQQDTFDVVNLQSQQ